MGDLVKEFFERDLPPDEEKKLAAILAASVLEADRFARLGEKFYVSLGLPEPTPPPSFKIGSGNYPSALLGVKGWITMIVATGVILSGVVYIVNKKEDPRREQISVQEVPQVSPVIEIRPTVRPAFIPVLAPTKTPTATIPPAPIAIQDLVMATPKPDIYETGDILAVKVRLESTSRLSVDIYAPDGTLVRNLISGVFVAKDYRFKWDGKDNEGRPVKPDRYRVVVNTGDGVMEQWLEMKKK